MWRLCPDSISTRLGPAANTTVIATALVAERSSRPPPPKHGKSTLAVELAISLATATPLFNVARFASHERARVTYVHQGENSRARIRKDFDLVLQARGLGVMEDVEAMPPHTVNEERAANLLLRLEGPEGEELFSTGERFVPHWGDGSPILEPDLELLINPGLVLANKRGETHPAVSAHRRWVERTTPPRRALPSTGHLSRPSRERDGVDVHPGVV
ncbi:MAG: hypothetical protein ACRDL5_17665 [Solirubrobacteraceae bacterium]